MVEFYLGGGASTPQAPPPPHQLVCVCVCLCACGLTEMHIMTICKFTPWFNRVHLRW